MYLHQQQVFEAVRGGHHVLVSTGTGSGKTESFLYPIVDDLLRQRDQGIASGLAAILVYPMNALANDQLDRLRDMLGGTGITFGQWVGTTPDKESDVIVERFRGSSRQAYLEERKRRREEAAQEDRAVRPLAPLEECCSEEDIRSRQPRILLTNYRQLEVLATRLPDVMLFAEAPLKYLVFDEAHTYAGATGAEVGCLVRRLRALAGKTPDEIICIGTSATLSDPTKKDRDDGETARRFASRFFGVDADKVTLVGESYVSREWPKQRYKPAAPLGDGMERLGRILHAVTEPVEVEVVKSVVEELTGQMGQPFVMVSAEEHTAQVPGEIRNRIENDFKSRHGRTNCLVATPTLEMGVNIGALDMALMRNVPPRSTNYWQRAGRAGREERMAVVVTYCRRSSHDRYFFDDPLRILGGVIEAPTFNLRNPLMVAKHIRSAILSELLLRSRLPTGDGDEVRAILKGLFPTYIRKYLLDEDNHFRDTPTSTGPLGELLAVQKGSLADRLVTLFAQHWPDEAKELATRAAVEAVIAATADELAVVINRLHRRLTWARSTRSELHRKRDAGLIEREEEQLLRRCDEYINSIVTCDRSTYTLTVLGVEGFLPGYGVYEGGITASARRGFARQSGPRTFDLSRSNVIALREFVPGNRLYANRGTFYVSRYHLGADETARIRTLLVNVEKRYITEQTGDAQYGQSGGVPIDAVPLADLDLAHESRITEDESLRFSMPVSVLGRLRKRNRGGQAFKIGDHEVSYVRGQGIELVNLGEANRVKQGELGHCLCSVCGAAKTPYAVPDEIKQFSKIHKKRCGKEVGWLALAVQAEVDMLQFHAIASEAEGINIGEALGTAATRLLDMGPEDLQLLVVQKPDDKIDLLIYDPMPGGSGLLEQMLARWQELIATAKQLLAGCTQECETACYACLKTFRNQFHHELLNRHKALELVETLNHVPQAYRDIVPVFEEERSEAGTPSNNPEARLLRLLRDHHFPAGECRKRITTTLGIATEPDWLHDPTKVAVYLDGMSRGLHGDPSIARKDQIIRQAVEFDGYTVIVVQSRDLDDPQAVRQHLRSIAQAMGRADLAN